MATFFVKTDPKFNPPSDDGTIETEHFLKAAKQIIPFFENLGTAFRPVKSDVDGNVTRLIKRYESDPEKFPTLRSILEDEVERKCAEGKDSATQGLLWLNRALEYTCLFLKLVADDHNSGAKTENIGPFARTAYDQTLKQYHGWIVQQVFGVVSRAIPWRRNFLKSLACEKDVSEDQVVADMLEYVEQVMVNIKAIHAMLVEMNLNFQTKV